ncbi:DUF4194 domain-containing protein [Pleionea litopenaei]|uniref:DUF4194 domain-containing protein n=1 Tax=Pleionea litopenaei TaxID=3070815 RepID=A0AA51RRG4_9GAMM|nr:DUF4194 domain-containing protein [Pleionea sp. HL-JVS1]WMS86173.1 DUF4194 domain-containing protein [Pleionea sp. HL-JVS1]
MIIFDAIEQQLSRSKVTIEEFQELVIRLLNYGVLSRQESATEELLYDRYVRIEELINEYLAVIKIRLYHDNHFQYVRLYPPSSEVPGVVDGEDSQFTGSLRQRLTQNEVALTLILRLQYDKALREGKIDDSGFALESLESISIAMKNMLKRSLPDKFTERKKLFSKLKQLRLIQFRQDEEFESSETWIKVHPMIVTFVSEEALEALDFDDDDDATIHVQSPAQVTLAVEED